VFLYFFILTKSKNQEIRNSHKIIVGIFEEIRHLEDQGLDMRIILNGCLSVGCEDVDWINLALNRV
jgi:hypothetical protein